MARAIIVLGDSIDHGGAVVSGSVATDVQGRPVARVGDRVICSKHGPTTIVAGDPTLVVDGRPVARHGDRTACGASLVSTRIDVTTG